MDGIERHMVQTADGSNTLFQPQMNEHYHSVNGALAESRHVFLEQGLEYFLTHFENPRSVSVAEIGFGTGLNFLLTANHCSHHNISLNYTGIEAFPLPQDLILETGYAHFTDEKTWAGFTSQYNDALYGKVAVNELVNLEITTVKWPQMVPGLTADVLYFDAFASAKQPEMWDDESISRAASLLNPGGVFVTYAITGKLKRQLKALDFTVQKAPGAPGKREMLRAIKQAA